MTILKVDRLSNLAIKDRILSFEYQIFSDPRHQWWAIYQGTMPSKNQIKTYLHWQWIYDVNAVQKQGTIEYEDPYFKSGIIYTLALFKAALEDTHDLTDYLADYIEFTIGEQTDFLSNLSISEKTIQFNYKISTEPYYQWWAIYQGTIPSRQNLKQYLHSDWLSNYSSVHQEGTIKYESTNLKSGTIYTLALFKDTEKNADDLADYLEFTVGKQTDLLSNFSISKNIIRFNYQISAQPYYQWWAIYLGIMPSWQNLRKYLHWDWLYDHNAVKTEGTIEWEFTKFEPGAIYTLALFKDTEKNADDLASYMTGVADEPDQSQAVVRKHLLENQ